MKKKDVVHPLGVDSEGISFDATSHKRVLLRYHTWLDDYSGIEGKYILVTSGKGMVVSYNDAP